MTNEEFVIPAPIKVKGAIINYRNEYYLGTAIFFTGENGLLYIAKDSDTVNSEDIKTIRGICESELYVELKVDDRVDLSVGDYFIVGISNNKIIQIPKEKLAIAEVIKENLKVQQIRKRKQKYVIGFSSATIISEPLG